MDRRHSLLAIAAGAFASRFANAQAAPPAIAAGRTIEQMRAEWRSFVPAGMPIPEAADKVDRTADAWRKELPPAAFRVLREEGTEPAGSSPLDREKRRGVFVCAGCGLPLFSSEMKYDSGTGWPSFFTTIPGVFGTKTDYKLILPRKEYHCARCGGHQGHVFDDGPRPTGERWCNNGVALRFIPAQS